MADFQEILYSRASIRAFTDAELSDEQLTELVRAGLAAPWAFHDHARHLCVIAGHENVQKLARVFAEVLGRPGYNMYAPAAAILACVERGNDNQKLEVGCMLENIFLRATDMGIGSCWIGFTLMHFTDTSKNTAFGIPHTHKPMFAVAFGRPAKGKGMAPKRREGTVNYL